jgi:hypothetical protein
MLHRPILLPVSSAHRSQVRRREFLRNCLSNRTLRRRRVQGLQSKGSAFHRGTIFRSKLGESPFSLQLSLIDRPDPIVQQIRMLCLLETISRMTRFPAVQILPIPITCPIMDVPSHRLMRNQRPSTSRLLLSRQERTPMASHRANFPTPMDVPPRRI